MAARTTSHRRSAKSPVAPTDAAVSKGIVTKPDDPLTWLFTNPLGQSASGLVFGVLRRSYGDRSSNSAAEFSRRKMQPIAPREDPASSPWMATAERVDVVLPEGTDDGLADPEALLNGMDHYAVQHEKALLVYLTLPLRDGERLHTGWERCRDFARLIARERGLASVVILHAPGRVGAPNAAHCHLLIVPRTCRQGLKYGVYDDDMTRDQGQALVETMWNRHLANGSS